jgi:hypothetical protein
MQKGQKAEDKTYIKLGPCWLGTGMEMHNSTFTSSEFIIYSGKTRRWSNSSLGYMPLQFLGTGGTCDPSL